MTNLSAFPLQVVMRNERDPVATVSAKLAQGADPNERGNDIESPLTCAVSSAIGSRSEVFKHIIRILVKHGADLNAADGRQGTPINYAIACCDPDVLELLLELGADPNRPDGQGVNPMEKAQSLGRTDMAAVLQKRRTPHAPEMRDSNIKDVIRFECPYCGKRLRAKGKSAGTTQRCPNPSCGQAISVPCSV